MQVELSEYLQCELFHVLGAYGMAEEGLADLSERLESLATPGNKDDQKGKDRLKGREGGYAALREITKMSREHNYDLKWHRYASSPGLGTEADGSGATSWPLRETLPKDLPLSKFERFDISRDDKATARDRDSPWKSDRDWEPIPRFYGLVIGTLEKEQSGGRLKDKGLEARRRQFAESIVAPRDGGGGGGEIDPARVKRRVYRYGKRLDESLEAIRGREPDQRSKKVAANYKVGDRKDFDAQLKWVASDLKQGPDSTAMFVLRAHVEGHLSMHAVEAWRNLSLGGKADSIQPEQVDWLEDELDRSIALSTFAFCAGRIMPWIFAKDLKERDLVLDQPFKAWENMIPVRCIWIATQISLLSLHRRAYARALKGDPTGAYNDYHKLQYLIRDTERRVRLAPLHVDGALAFLAGLNAEAHHHIGELYRSEHAHRPALEHFRAGYHGLGKLKSESEGRQILLNSRWFVELQVSHGKACYEMGRHKEALRWHLSAWKSFLGLLSSETSTTPNTTAIEEALEWLDRVKYEPDIHKSEIDARIGPVVEQLERITMVGRLGALAAEILLRLGHLLFVLNIRPWARRDEDDEKEGATALAVACLVKAGQCDPHSSLVGADLLKAALRQRHHGDGRVAPEIVEILGSIAPLGEQWPGGGGDFEELARAAEYLALRGQLLDRPAEPGGDDAEPAIARALMLDLFMSTDSTDVRKSQIHRFLMKKQTKGADPKEDGSHIELVCMRRYSSAFPLLPRPSAFRALGGGYFVRVHAAPASVEEERAPVGIVVDPGNDFVENLYRAGFALSDIDMIIVTHDHVDHVGGLDPLLSLLHVRSQILSKEDPAKGVETTEARPVTVLTSRSVFRRYMSASVLQGSKTLSFECFEDDGGAEDAAFTGETFVPYEPGREVEMDGVTHRFEVLPMSSEACNPNELRPRPGHRDLSDRASFGICIRAGQTGPSVAITSDTPEPHTDEASRKVWQKEFRPALDADVLVCHLGSVPLTELRRMDGYDPKNLDPADPELDFLVSQTKKDEKNLRDFREKLQAAHPHRLQGQVEYAHWLRSHKGGRRVPTADLVGRVDPRWLPPRDHNYLRGLLTWAEAFRSRTSKLRGAAKKRAKGAEPQIGGRLFVVGELSEELGTMRGKLSARLNQHVFIPPVRGGGDAPARQQHSALTADIGLQVYVGQKDSGPRRIEVLCTTCNLDTDRAREERHHAAGEINEVCVKGENEGIFYNCQEHHPTARRKDEAFLERLERFDIFGR